MEFLNWEWVTSNGLKVPDLEEIIHHARTHLTDVLSKGYERNEKCTISCGGFEATYTPYEDNEIGLLELKFVLTDWEETL